MSDGTDSPSEDLAAKVLRALKKGGYALEMRIAAKADQAGADLVGQSRYYIDPVTDKPREIDVLALWSAEVESNDPCSTHIFLVIECKSQPGPWVIFDDGFKVKDDPLRNFDRTAKIIGPNTNKSYFEEKLKLSKDGDTPVRTVFTSTDYGMGNGIVEVSTKSVPDTKANETNKAWAAVQGAVAAAHGMHEEMLKATLDGANIADQERPFLMTWLPIVVTSGNLFRCWLDENGEMAVAEIEAGSVGLRGGSSKGYTRCLVVTEDAASVLFESTSATFALFQGRAPNAE